MSLKEEKRVYELPEEEEEESTTYNKAPIYLKDYVESYDGKQMDAVADFLTQDHAASKKMSFSIALLILSLSFVVMGAAMDELYYLEMLGVLVGFGGMVGSIVFGIAGIIKAAKEKSRIRKNLDRAVITESIKDYVEDLDKKYNSTLVKNLVVGILLCVFSPVLTVIMVAMFIYSEGILFGSIASFFAIIALGVYMIVSSALISDSYKKVIFFNDRPGYRRYRNNRRY